MSGQAGDGRRPGPGHRDGSGRDLPSSAGRWARYGAAIVVAGLLAGGAPAAAVPAGWSGSGGDILPPVAERASTAATDRLAPAARGYAEATWSEALALATAALAAARAVEAAPAGSPPGDTLPARAPAVGRLVTLLGPAEGRVRVPGDPGVSAAVARAAGEVLRYAMEVESGAEVAAREAAAARTQRLVALERAADAAADAASVLAGLEPLAPSALTTSLDPSSAQPSGGTGGVGAASGARARLRPDAPDGVGRLVRRWSNGMVPAEALCAVPFAPGELLQCDAAAALSGLNDAYRARFGTDLDVVSSYRSLSAQVGLRATKPGLAAVPGTSNHGWGLAVDLGGIGGLGEFDAPGYLWLSEHAGAFGWHHPPAMGPEGSGPPEPWHWEFGTA